jgi:hypothetical protein
MRQFTRFGTCFVKIKFPNHLFMTLQHFNSLNDHIQYRNLLLNGICLKDRYVDDACVLLFQLDKFYVEVFFDKNSDEILKCRSFESTDDLWPYLEPINTSHIA